MPLVNLARHPETIVGWQLTSPEEMLECWKAIIGIPGYEGTMDEYPDGGGARVWRLTVKRPGTADQFGYLNDWAIWDGVTLTLLPPDVAAQRFTVAK